MMNAFSKFVLVVCFALFVSQGLLAQSDLGKISGFIKDPSGATIANAKVTIRNNTGGVERQTTTNDSGYYVVTNVPPGLYTMIAEATGFQKYESTNNKLDPAADLVIDATLSVGSSRDRKSTRLNSSHSQISYAVFCLKKKKRTFDAYYVLEP